MSPRGPGLIEVYWRPQCGRIEAVVLTDSTTIQSVNGGGNMYRGGGANMYHGLGGSLSA